MALPDDPTIKLPPFPSRQAVVNVDRTATTAFIRWLEQWLTRVKEVGDGLIDGDIPAGDVTPGSIDITDLIAEFQRDVAASIGYDGVGVHARVEELRNRIEQLAQSVTNLGYTAATWNYRVEAQFAGNEASFAQQVLAFVTSEQAFATQLTTLEASFTTQYDSLSGDVEAANEAITTANAAIIDEATVRADADAALAVVDTSLLVSYNDVSAGGMSRFEVAATAAGATASYQLAVRSVVAGVTYSGGLRLFINVDEFIVGDDSVSSAPFSVSGGQVYISNAYIVNLLADNITFKGLDGDDVLVDSTIITDLLANNAAVKADSTVTTGSITLITAETTIQTFAFTPVNGKVEVKASLTTSATVAGTATIRLKRAGATIYTWGLDVRSDVSSTHALFYIDTSPGTSSVTWTVTLEFTGAGSIRAFNRFLGCVNYKKQA
jgi:hypothetical protein